MLRSRIATQIIFALLVLGLTILVADVAWAQGILGSVGAKADALQATIFKVLRALFIIGAGILGYMWVKGSHEARERTERYLIGLVIAFGATEIVDAFTS